MVDFGKLAEQYKKELLENVLPFWLEKSQDRQHGGYYTCLDREGNVFDRDKFVWLQGREIWMFAMLCNKLGKNEEWLECAVQGADFLKKYGHDGNYNWYFSLAEDGRPLVEPYNIFSYAFATMLSDSWDLQPDARNIATLPEGLSISYCQKLIIPRADGTRRLREHVI